MSLSLNLLLPAPGKGERNSLQAIDNLTGNLTIIIVSEINEKKNSSGVIK